MPCASCGKESSSLQRCARCKQEKYCSRECQVKHWSVHKQYCKPAAARSGSSAATSSACGSSTPSTFDLSSLKDFPLEIRESPGKGRGIFTSRALQPGDVLLKETAYVAVPLLQEQNRCCFFCLLPLEDETKVPCACGMFSCSMECKQKWQPIHAHECPLIRSILHLAVKVEVELPMLMMALRVLIHRHLERTDPTVLPQSTSSSFHAKYADVQSLATHAREFPEEMIRGFSSSAHQLVSLLPPYLSVPAEQVLKVFLAAFVNAHGTGPTGDVGSGLFPLSSMFNHSCAPNAVISTVVEQYTCALILRAITPIAVGEEVTISYIDPQLPTSLRKAELKASKFFDCQCPKCSDPTDCFSFSFVCTKCKEGIITPQQNKPTVSCPKCGSTFDANALFANTLRMRQTYNQINVLKQKGNQEKALELALATLKNMDSLHPQNYILFTFHRLVAELYQYQKKYRESLPYLQLMAKSTEVSLPLYHPQKAVYYEAVLDACIALHMQEPASLEEMAPIWRPATERTLDIFSVTHGKDHANYQRVLTKKLELERLLTETRQR